MPLRLYQMAKIIFVANLPTALVVAVGGLLLVARLLAILARDFCVTDQIGLQQYLPSAIGDLRLVEAPLHAATWLVVITSSLACMYHQAHLLWHTRLVVVRSWTRLRWLEIAVLFFAGLLSAGTFSFIVTKASGSVDQLEMGSTLKTPFYLTAGIRSAQSVFSAFFTATIMPMSRRWANQLDWEQKKSLKNLLSLRVLLYFHWNILIPTFFSKAIATPNLFSPEAASHAASFVYRNVVIIWLFLLVACINRYQPQEERATPGNSGLVAGIIPTNPELSELLTTQTHVRTHPSYTQEEESRVPNNSEKTRLTCAVPVYPKQSELVTRGNYLPPSPQQEELVMPVCRVR